MENVEDIYPLSPMQQMMLFHAQTQPRRDVLFNQVCYQLHGQLDARSLVAAWQAVLSRHPALRTLFLSEGLPKPVQVVRKHIDIPFTSLDWRDRPEQDKSILLDELRARDRDQPFDPGSAPLMRVTLAQVEDDAFYMLWSSHHLVLDRWCIPIIMRDLAENYRAALEQRLAVLGPSGDYRDYIRWIEGRDQGGTRRFWQSSLAGYVGDSKLTKRCDGAPAEQGSLELPGEDWAALAEFCRRSNLTVASLVQAGWALLVNRLTGEQDVVFGVVSSGRPAEVPEVENTVGSFVANLPLRAQLAADAGVARWLSRLQSAGRQRLPYEYVSLAQVGSWCDMPPSRPLIDSLIVWLAETGQEHLAGVQTEVVDSSMGTAFPLTLYVEQRESALVLTLELSQGYVAVASLDEMLAELRSILGSLAACPDEARLDSLSGFRGGLGAVELMPSASTVSAPDVTAPGEDSGVVSGGRETPGQAMLEELVTAQWITVLGLERVARDIDFFSVGGDSLQASRLVDCLQTALHRDIPMLALFREPTIAGMARVILEQDWSVTQRVATPVKENGPRRPLFCVASPEVDTIGYAILARHVDPDRPVYLLQAPPLNESVRRLQPPEFAQLAATYIEAMRDIQPTGPFNLIGMCSGSQIEIEICRKLEAEGESIAFSGILDTWALYTLSRGYYVKKALDLARYYSKRLRKMGAGSRSEEAVSADKPVDPGEPGNEGQKPLKRDGTGKAVRQYSLEEEVGWPEQQPPLMKIDSRVTVFRQRKRKQYWRIRDPLLGWGRHANSVDLVRLRAPGHKHIFREPWVRELARDLESRLA